MNSSEPQIVYLNFENVKEKGGKKRRRKKREVKESYKTKL
jgi:hypothetical protein